MTSPTVPNETRVLPERCDVVVIGGGPAGSTAAALLAQKGYETVLIEKARHPRLAVGESIIPHFWRYAEHSGVAEKIAAEGFITKAGGTVSWEGRTHQMRFRDFGYTQPALHVERGRFDQIMFEHAREQGAMAVENVAVTGIDFSNPDEPVVNYRPTTEDVTRQIRCRFVVDASGQGAVVARQQRLRVLDNDFRFMSLWGHFRGGRYVAADGRAYSHDRIREVQPTTFVTQINGWSWLWHIPLREVTSVGLVLEKELLDGTKGVAEMKATFLELCRSTPAMASLLEGAELVDETFRIVRDYSYLPTQVAGPGFFLIGDAAAFVDPIFSIGVVLGMYGAYLATWAIDRSFRNPASVEHNRALFSNQITSRLHASRGLALPSGDSSDEAVEAIGKVFAFETALEKELMYVVSRLTTRSGNFVATAEREGLDVTSERYRLLDEITF